MSIAVINRTGGAIPIVRYRSIARRTIAFLRSKRKWPKTPYSLGIVFISAKESALLHRRFLKKSGPANVLSFDYGSEGEVLLTPTVIRRMSRVYSESFSELAKRLLIHGLLHVSGLDHELSREAGVNFERIETEAIRRVGKARI